MTGMAVISHKKCRQMFHYT